MCWIFKNARMMHPPRTAGHWIVGAARNAGLEVYRWGPKHSFLADSCGENMPTFCVVRDPVTWYKSYFGFKNTPGAEWGAKHQPWSRLDKKCWAGEINTFAERVCNWRSGFYSQIIRKYTIGADIKICRFETLVDDVIDALIWAGEPVNQKAFRKTKVLNAKDKFNKNRASGANRHFMEMTEETVAMIREHEHDYYERFGE